MVLPDRIELSTSPLPRECSTTELRQQGARPENRRKKCATSGRFLPQGPLRRKRLGPSKSSQGVLICDQFRAKQGGDCANGRAGQYNLADRPHGNGSTMTTDKDRDRPPVKDSRHERLKNKLRENLRRRKSQERERGRMPDAPAHDGEASPDGEVGKSD
jgi:hypothetical protein